MCIRDRIYVEQIGVACHTGAYSCFFDEVLPFNNLDILHDLYDLIEDRKVHPIEKSYTNYLLDQGIDKICKKVGEEASETIIAAKMKGYHTSCQAPVHSPRIQTLLSRASRTRNYLS